MVIASNTSGQCVWHSTGGGGDGSDSGQALATPTPVIPLEVLNPATPLFTPSRGADEATSVGTSSLCRQWCHTFPLAPVQAPNAGSQVLESYATPHVKVGHPFVVRLSYLCLLWFRISAQLPTAARFDNRTTIYLSGQCERHLSNKVSIGRVNKTVV